MSVPTIKPEVRKPTPKAPDREGKAEAHEPYEMSPRLKAIVQRDLKRFKNLWENLAKP